MPKTPRLNPENYARVSSIITHSTIKATVDFTFPDLTKRERDEVIIDIIARMARMRGYELRCVHAYATADEEDHGE